MRKFFGEFKKFITRGNVIDMSVGVIVGGAFTAIVNGLSNFILKPIINWLLALLLGQDSLSGIYTYLKPVYVAELDVNGVATGNQVIDLSQSIYIDWGAFINAIINFLLIAFVLFCIVKVLNSVAASSKKMQDKKTRILYKKEKGFKLSKKEKAFLEAEELKEKEAAEAKAKEEEEARIKAEEEANKVTKSEALLSEIRDLLAKKK